MCGHRAAWDAGSEVFACIRWRRVAGWSPASSRLHAAERHGVGGDAARADAHEQRGDGFEKGGRVVDAVVDAGGRPLLLQVHDLRFLVLCQDPCVNSLGDAQPRAATLTDELGALLEKQEGLQATTQAQRDALQAVRREIETTQNEIVRLPGAGT